MPPRRRQPEGPPPAPAVQKLRVQYARRGRLRYSSTRDFARALERALRRAQVPMAFSAGFHPHPRISYAGAAPTGTASEAEYFELQLTQEVDPQALAATLDAALPPGLDIVKVVPATSTPLADLLQASVWQVRWDDAGGEDAAAALTAYLACESAPVTRMVKAGPRTFDTRAAVAAARIEQGEGACAILHLVVRHTTPAVRPDDILTALRAVTAFTPPVAPLVTRLAQGPLLDAGDGVADPLAAEREAVGS